MAASGFAFMRFSLSNSRIVLLASALTLAAPAAFPEPPKGRAEALAALAASETTARLEAIVWLANHGGMADAPRLDALLRDDNALVRDYAEQGLWALWSRTGDAALDRLMARGVEEVDAENYRAAIATFSEIVSRKRDFAEGRHK